MRAYRIGGYPSGGVESHFSGAFDGVVRELCTNITP
jgi:hypothetical protein